MEKREKERIKKEKKRRRNVVTARNNQGHLKKYCQKKKADKKADKTKDNKMSMTNSSEKEKKEGTLTAKVTTMAESSSNSKFLQLFIANTLTERSGLTCKWIIDLGASSPISCHCN